MKRAVLFGSVALAILCLFSLPRTTLGQEYIYVSQSTGSDTTGDGSPQNPFATIGKAAPLDPFYIFVAAGTYNECVRLYPYVVLSGGYDPMTWTRNIPVFRTVINGCGISPLIPQPYYWYYEIDGFVIQNANRGIDMGTSKAYISNTIIRNSNIGVYTTSYIYFRSDSFPGLVSLSNSLVIGNNIGVSAATINFCEGPYYDPGCQCERCASYGCVNNYTNITLTNTTVAGNLQQGITRYESAPYGCHDPASNVTSIRNSIIVNNTDDLNLFGTVNIDYSDIGEGWGSGTGNLSVDPLFWDDTQMDHGLRPASQCIDAGDPAVQFNDPDGTRNDMGFTGGTSAFFDTDYDGIPDSWEIYYGLDPDNPADALLDCDSDSVINRDEYFQGTEPGYCDSDGDGLADAAEINTYHTDPYNADTDGDYIPDGYEAGHMSGERPLNPLDPGDGNVDFEGAGFEDGNPNYHEYWNGTDPWHKDPVPNPLFPGGPGCYYWGEGDGDGYVLGGDKSILQAEILGAYQSYSDVIPRGVPDVQDLDADGYILGGDLTILKSFIITALVGPVGSRAAALEKVYEPLTPVSVGGTAHVTVRVRNESVENNLYSGGFSVVFSIDPASIGGAVLLGGEGSYGPGTRFDVSGPSGAVDGGHATIFMKITAAGTIVINAAIPACGAHGVGRWVDEITLDPAFTITAQ